MQLELKDGSNGRMSLNVARRFVCATGGVFHMYDVCGISVFVDRNEHHPDIITVCTLDSAVYS